MRVIPNSATQNTISIYRQLNRMSKHEIMNMNITIFAESYPTVSYACVYSCVRQYRALNGLF